MGEWNLHFSMLAFTPPQFFSILYGNNKLRWKKKQQQQKNKTIKALSSKVTMENCESKSIGDFFPILLKSYFCHRPGKSRNLSEVYLDITLWIYTHI